MKRTGPEIGTRRIALRAPVASDSATLTATLATGARIEREFGGEVLVMTDEALDAAHISEDGRLPLLAWHDQNRMPLGYVDGFRFEDGRWRGELHLADTENGREVRALHASGVPLGVSLGYRRDWNTAEFDEGGATVIFRRWQPIEVSIAPVPADPASGVGRSMGDTATGGDTTMTGKGKDEGGGAPTSPAPASDFDTAFRNGRQSGLSDGVRAERARLSEIGDIFELDAVRSAPNQTLLAALRATAVNDGWSADRTRAEVLRRLGDAGGDGDGGGDGTRSYATPAVSPQTQGSDTARSVRAGADSLDKALRGMEAVLCLRAGLNVDDAMRTAVRESGFASMSLAEMAREFLRLSNSPGVRAASVDEMVGAAFGMRAGGHGTSDFPALMSNVANRALLVGYMEQPETWAQWCRIGSARDFRTHERAGLSHFSDLEAIPEDGEPRSGTLTDFKETFALVEYARSFALTRRVIVNDDLDAFTRVPRLMGRAANRRIGDQVIATLTANSGAGPTLNQDSTALFHANHSNLVASGTAPTVAALNTAKASMRTQTDPSGVAVLNIMPRYLLAPAALEGTVLPLIAAEKDPAVASGESPNPHYRKFDPIIEPRLDAISATAWYLMADATLADTMEVVFLNGVREPYLREEVNWTTRGVKWVTGIDAAVLPLDFRGMFRNSGTGG